MKNKLLLIRYSAVCIAGFWFSFTILDFALFQSRQLQPKILDHQYHSRVDRELLESINDYPTSTEQSMSTESVFESWLREQDRRRKVVENVCKMSPALHFSYPSLARFIYEPYNRILYCRHAKVGTTTWLSEILNHSNVSIRSGGKSSKELHDKVPRLFNLGSLRTLRKKIHTAESFTMVRHPFERIVSAYKDKISIGIDPTFAKVRKKILVVYGDLSFKSFTTFIVDQAQHVCRSYSKCGLDLHWLPYVARCGYCQVPYRYLLKAEEFEQEMDNFSLATNVPFTKSQYHKSKGDTRQMVADFFKTVPQHIIERLKKLYGPDFQMFEYDPDEFLDQNL